MGRLDIPWMVVIQLLTRLIILLYFTALTICVMSTAPTCVFSSFLFVWILFHCLYGVCVYMCVCVCVQVCACSCVCAVVHVHMLSSVCMRMCVVCLCPSVCLSRWLSLPKLLCVCLSTCVRIAVVIVYAYEEDFIIVGVTSECRRSWEMSAIIFNRMFNVS